MLNKRLSLKQHFTDAKDINSMMCHLLGNVSGLAVLEPSVGHGAFLRGLLGTPSRIDVVDVDESALDVVRSSFNADNINIFKADFIELFASGVLGSTHPIRTRRYDAVVSNPPYGLYFDVNYRKLIKRLFPDLYARESYGLFFAFAVSRLRDEGHYAFLLPDTFLSSVNHRPLRSLMCAEAAPTHIIRFPSKLFETVNFGYGNLCIIAGSKAPLSPTGTVQWVDAFDNGGSLSLGALEGAKAISGASLIENADLGWHSAIIAESIVQRSKWQTLGDIADCRTGIYTGDNEKFIGYDATRVMRRLNGHAIDWNRQVRVTKPDAAGQQEGISDDAYYVPLIRGGHREPFDKTAWAIRWDAASLQFYKSNKKARFQNSSFYFRKGLAVPMVTTKRISASLMSDAVFDQGVVGVFPQNESLISPILLYLNSTEASMTMKRMVNGSANNSANYLKRLPVPSFSSIAIKEAEKVVGNAMKSKTLSFAMCDEFCSKHGTKLPG